MDELDKNVQEGAIIDIEREDLDKILAEENVMKQSIHEANIKWHSDDEQEFRTLTGKYALDFLKTMNGTLCYLMVAFRMLAKAPWTARMVCVHVRQGAKLLSMPSPRAGSSTPLLHMAFSLAEQSSLLLLALFLVISHPACLTILISRYF